MKKYLLFQLKKKTLLFEQSKTFDMAIEKHVIINKLQNLKIFNKKFIINSFSNIEHAP